MPFAILALALALIFPPSPTGAQPAPRCMPLDVVTAVFQERFSEQVVWVGVDQQGRQIVVLGQPDGGTFTIFLVTNGVACGVASGISWAAIAPEPSLPGEEG